MLCSRFNRNYGEDVVLRILDRSFSLLSFNDLNMCESNIANLERLLTHQSGLILVTGPTGSGKSSTIYAMLNHLKQQQRGVIISIEDPVERRCYGVRQSSINEAAGYNYEKALKAVLRQDPDVIMIGEIRDSITAAIAIQAAYTGHLVISTLHTHDIPSSLKRLRALNCDEDLLHYCLRGIISQKLLPTPCLCQEKKHVKCVTEQAFPLEN